MITNEEARKAIEKYQKEHPLHFGMMIDVTAISSEEGVDIVSQQIEKIKKKVDEDTDLWCICEMAKMYIRGVKPVYPVKQKGKWIYVCCYGDEFPQCSVCGEINDVKSKFCPDCGADMRGEENGK